MKELVQALTAAICDRDYILAGEIENEINQNFEQ